ncbi:hypothetical protein [Edaphovirga cremea]|nr:hypothetical protein [Edaphovirga cremea]
MKSITDAVAPLASFNTVAQVPASIVEVNVTLIEGVPTISA